MNCYPQNLSHLCWESFLILIPVHLTCINQQYKVLKDSRFYIVRSISPYVYYIHSNDFYASYFQTKLIINKIDIENKWKMYPIY